VRDRSVVLTPHLGWIADLTYRLMSEVVVRIIEAHLDGADVCPLNPGARAVRPSPPER
jgi:hypothetical protein